MNSQEGVEYLIAPYKSSREPSTASSTKGSMSVKRSLGTQYRLSHVIDEKAPRNSLHLESNTVS